jgi:hypothetical protein
MRGGERPASRRAVVSLNEGIGAEAEELNPQTLASIMPIICKPKIGENAPARTRYKNRPVRNGRQ